MNSTSVPLSQELPWSINHSRGRNFAICDALETDGRFLLHTLATQVLNESSANGLLWIAGGTWTDRLIATSLKKMGCDTAAAHLRSITEDRGKERSDRPLHIISVGTEIAERLEDTSLGTRFDCEFYLKELYKRIESWATKNSESDSGVFWIVLDEVSSMALLLGERLVYCFIMSLRALIKRLNRNVSLVFRCSSDLDQQDFARGGEQLSSGVHPSGNTVDWIGVNATQDDLYKVDKIPWERHLVEHADGIIDVLPLLSGYSREAHGRLVFTAPPGNRGWGQPNPTKKTGTISPLSTNVINFCLTDNLVTAIRLRTTGA